MKTRVMQLIIITVILSLVTSFSLIGCTPQETTEKAEVAETTEEVAETTEVADTESSEKVTIPPTGTNIGQMLKEDGESI